MSVRVGHTFQDRQGHRYWVSVPLHDLAAIVLLGGWIVIVPWAAWEVIKWAAWTLLELALFAAGLARVLWALGHGRASLADITTGHGWWHTFWPAIHELPG
jgi:hypothetical protein